MYPVQHLPIIKAYADQLGLVSLINHYVPTEMDVDAGTIVGFQERAPDNVTCYIIRFIASRRLWHAEHAWS